MDHKYYLNGVDLTDVAGLDSGQPRYYLDDEATSLPSTPGHRGQGLQSNEFNGIALPSKVLTTSTLVTILVAVTDMGINDRNTNFANNKSYIRSLLYSKKSSYPVLRYYPYLDSDDLATEQDVYYESEVRMPIPPVWYEGRTANGEIDPFTGKWAIILEIPSGTMYSNWVKAPITLTGSSAPFVGSLVNSFLSSSPNTDWCLSYSNETDTGAYTPSISIKEGNDATAESVVSIANPNAGVLKFFYSSEYKLYYVVASGGVNYDTYLLDTTVTSDKAYRNLLAALNDGNPISFNPTQSHKFKPNSASGDSVFSITGSTTKPTITLYYRNRLV